MLVLFRKQKYDIIESVLIICFSHEITGIITEVGCNVSNFKVGDRAGVGCLAASCLNCDYCKDGQENYCDQLQFTYNGIFWDGSITYGGYSKFLVADHRYHIKSNITCTKMYAKMMWDCE